MHHRQNAESCVETLRSQEINDIGKNELDFGKHSQISFGGCDGPGGDIQSGQAAASLLQDPARYATAAYADLQNILSAQVAESIPEKRSVPTGHVLLQERGVVSTVTRLRETIIVFSGRDGGFHPSFRRSSHSSVIAPMTCY